MEIDGAAIGGMHESEPCRMERGAGDERGLAAVGEVAHERMTDGGELHADLVASARLQVDLDQRRRSEALEHAEPGCGAACALLRGRSRAHLEALGVLAQMVD